MENNEEPTEKRLNNNSDSDSDVNNEHLIGNVQRVAIVPPNYEGKPKKGHLIFDASFECGNLGRIDYVNENEYDLFIRPDTCSPRFRCWFLFTVENVKADQVCFHQSSWIQLTSSVYIESHFSYCQFLQSEIVVSRWYDTISQIY